MLNETTNESKNENRTSTLTEEITEKEILTHTQKLKLEKSSGPDRIILILFVSSTIIPHISRHGRSGSAPPPPATPSATPAPPSPPVTVHFTLHHGRITLKKTLNMTTMAKSQATADTHLFYDPTFPITLNGIRYRELTYMLQIFPYG
ncbi:unnamed protein product [Leptidea sinapis]|uniref:Uncharacterized protein n=1 Tax=Leptidea sinapis TaxID=189913 RepID=A0A5E4Q656_9NEOP|nr:unnamed protein product [Leptidea sinapis]